MIIMIWAEDSQGAIGKQGKLPWRLPNDMKFFKNTTSGHTVVMGRKTFESMGKKPLPERKNVILTRQKEYESEDGIIIHTPEEINRFVSEDEEVYIIGGSEIYQLFLPYADVLWRTKIAGDFAGDTFFPEVNWNEWSLAEEVPGILDEKNKHPHVFQKYVRK